MVNIILPEDVRVVLIVKEYNGVLGRTSEMQYFHSILRGVKCFEDSKRDCRIFPVKVDTHPSSFSLKYAWDEGLTLEEFKEYLYD